MFIRLVRPLYLWWNFQSRKPSLDYIIYLGSDNSSHFSLKRSDQRRQYYQLSYELRSNLWSLEVLISFTGWKVWVPRLFTEALCRDKDPKDVTQAQAEWGRATTRWRCWPDVAPVFKVATLLQTSISHLWKRTIIFPATFKGDMWVPCRVTYANLMFAFSLLSSSNSWGNLLEKCFRILAAKVVIGWHGECLHAEYMHLTSSSVIFGYQIRPWDAWMTLDSC